MRQERRGDGHRSRIDEQRQHRRAREQRNGDDAGAEAGSTRRHSRLPVLAAGSFDITNSDKLVQHATSGANGAQHVTAASADEPVEVEMTMPWGGEIPQLLKAMASSVVSSAIDHIRCDFVHAGSNQPYYSTPVSIRQLTTSMAGAVGGPPVDGFASFAATGSSTTHFAPEGSFPAWATGAMANVESLSISFQRTVVVVKHALPDGTQQAVPAYGNMAPTTATFVKPVGSLSNDLQAAISGRQRVTTTFELADTPGRLAYSFQFTNGYISSDHTSLSNGHATEQVTVSSGSGVVVTNLRSNVTAQVQ